MKDRIKQNMQRVIDVSGLENIKIVYRHSGNIRLAWDMFWMTGDSDTLASELYESGYNDQEFENLLLDICMELDLVVDLNWIKHRKHTIAA